MNITCFHKYHALGNDFIVVDFLKSGKAPISPSKLAKKICDRNQGVGADGILVLSHSSRADLKMEVYNSDGSWAERSGNGLRIAAVHFSLEYKARNKMTVETSGDIVEARFEKASPDEFLVTVSLGSPRFETKSIPMKSRYKYHINRPLRIGGLSYTATVLTVGNPHTVIFVDNFSFDWKGLGRQIENSPIFPSRTNVEFAKVVNKSRVILNDWERGAGATGSSGTGAAATVVAGSINGLLKRAAEVVFPSGSLYINWGEKDDQIYLTGPVCFICSGLFCVGDK
jgi:diaminopimelate epimerase